MADPVAPTFTVYDWLALVLEAEPKRAVPEKVYKFSNDREFESTDQTDSGVYDGD